MQDHKISEPRRPETYRQQQHAATGRLRFLALVSVLMAGVLGAPPAARADIWLFKDLTDGPAFTHIGSDDTLVSGSCGVGQVEGCDLVFTRGGQTNNLSSFPGVFTTIGEFGSPDVVSDFFHEFSLPNTTAHVGFSSETEGAAPILCTAFGAACAMTEDGTVQNAPFTITWSGGGTDTIQFQSDVEPVGSQVPEPSSVALLGSVLSALGLAALRRKRKPVSP